MDTSTLTVPSSSATQLVKLKDLKTPTQIIAAAALPPLSSDLRDALRGRIEAGGATEPLVVWAERQAVLDGVERLTIYKRLGLDVAPVVMVELNNDQEAIAYRISCNLTRRHLNDWQRARMAAESVLRNSTKRANGKGNKWDDIERIYKVKRDMVTQAQRILKDGPKFLRENDYSKLIEQLNVGQKATYSAFNKVVDASNLMTGKPKLSTDDKPVNPMRKSKDKASDLASVSVNSITAIHCVDGMRQFSDNSVDLIVTSPPYHGINEDYGGVYNPSATYGKFFRLMESCCKEFGRIVKDGGTVAINCDNATSHTDKRDDAYRYPQTYDTLNLLRANGFIYFDTVVWVKIIPPGSKPSSGNIQSPRFRSRYESIVIATKGKPAKHSYGEVEGATPDHYLSREEAQLWGENVWIDISTRSGRADTGEHHCPFPPPLPERLIKLFTNPGALVLDPFNGSGTTTAVAAKLKRRYIGFDLNKDYVAHARERTAAANFPAEKKLNNKSRADKD